MATGRVHTSTTAGTTLPKSDVELTSAVARWSAGAGAGWGYDLTFSPRQVRLCAVGPGCAGGGGTDRSGAPGRGCATLAGGPRPPGSAGRVRQVDVSHRVGRHLVHPPRQPGRR